MTTLPKSGGKRRNAPTIGQTLLSAAFPFSVVVDEPAQAGHAAARPARASGISARNRKRLTSLNARGA